MILTAAAIACLIAAVAGGKIKAGDFEIPLLESMGRRVALFVGPGGL